jgi:hypothetical protein
VGVQNAHRLIKFLTFLEAGCALYHLIADSPKLKQKEAVFISASFLWSGFRVNQSFIALKY